MQEQSSSSKYWENIRLAVQYLQQKGQLQLEPDVFGYCSIKVGALEKKFKALDVVYASWYSTAGFTTEKIICIDLNPKNLSPRNLRAISKEDWLSLKEAILNINEALRLVSHPLDQFKVVLEYRKDSRRCKRTFEDSEPAKRLLLQKQLEALKIINKFCTV